jgi:hypothetical protein
MKVHSICLVVLSFWALSAYAGTISVNLGAADTFGLLGGTISNTGTSFVEGNVGATTTITGFPPGTASGTVYTAPNGPTSIVGMAYTAFENADTQAWSYLSTALPLGTLSTSETFTGNNAYASTADISTTTGINLTFDAQGNPNEVFVILVNGALTVNGAMTFTLEGGAQTSNIFWVVEDAATISVGSAGPITFDGNILAGSSFTMSAGSGGSGVLTGTINGCVYAETANTLAGETDIQGPCAPAGGSVPEPGTATLLGMGLLLSLIVYGRQSRSRRRKI